jgi:hypothetical protein
MAELFETVIRASAFKWGTLDHKRGQIIAVLLASTALFIRLLQDRLWRAERSQFRVRPARTSCWTGFGFDCSSYHLEETSNRLYSIVEAGKFY